MTELGIVIIAAVTSTYALIATLFTIRRGRRKIAALEQLLAESYATQSFAATSLRALTIWRDNQLKGRYDRIRGEIEALKAAAQHHEEAMLAHRDLIRSTGCAFDALRALIAAEAAQPELEDQPSGATLENLYWRSATISLLRQLLVAIDIEARKARTNG